MLQSKYSIAAFIRNTEQCTNTRDSQYKVKQTVQNNHQPHLRKPEAYRTLPNSLVGLPSRTTTYGTSMFMTVIR